MPEMEPPRPSEPTGALLGGRMRPWVLEDLLKVLTSLCPDQVSKLLEEGELVRLSVSPSRESWSWVREGRDTSWGNGGFLRTPVYRAVLSSHVGGDSKFRKSKMMRQTRETLVTQEDLDIRFCIVQMAHLWLGKPQPAREKMSKHILKV